jgi:hypothetical protein
MFVFTRKFKSRTFYLLQFKPPILTLQVFSENNPELPGVSRHNKCRGGAEWDVASTAGRPTVGTKLIRNIY